jgi:hypothetical protein
MRLPPALARFIKGHINAILRDAITIILTGVALQPEEKARVVGLLGSLDKHPDLDTDGDGVVDSLDAAPLDPTVWKFDPVTGEPLSPPKGGTVEVA